MLIRWNPEYSVGIDFFDEQHKELFSLINGLQLSLQIGKSEEVLHQILDGLVNYTKTHFSNEERAMRISGYPDYEAHKKEHEAFVNKIAEYYTVYITGKPVDLRDMVRFLLAWLREHIARSDKLYGPHLVAKGVITGQYIGSGVEYLEWKDDYKSGVKILDDEHQKLFQLINKSICAIGDKQGETVLELVFDEVIEYAKSHFDDEEKMMLSCDYPFYEDHKREHEEMLLSAISYHDSFYKKKTALTINIMEFLIGWLKHHVGEADKIFAIFLSENKAPPAGATL